MLLGLAALGFHVPVAHFDGSHNTMHSVIAYPLIFLTGLAIGYVSSMVQTGSSMGGTLHLFKMSESSQAHARALQAYQHEPSEVAIWELSHLIDLLNEHLELGVESTNSMHFQLALAHGRLAHAFGRSGDEPSFSHHCEVGFGYYYPLYKTAGATNADTFADMILRFDSRTDTTVPYRKRQVATKPVEPTGYAAPCHDWIDDGHSQ